MAKARGKCSSLESRDRHEFSVSRHNWPQKTREPPRKPKNRPRVLKSARMWGIDLCVVPGLQPADVQCIKRSLTSRDRGGCLLRFLYLQVGLILSPSPLVLCLDSSRFRHRSPDWLLPHGQLATPGCSCHVRQPLL